MILLISTVLAASVRLGASLDTEDGPYTLLRGVPLEDGTLVDVRRVALPLQYVTAADYVDVCKSVGGRPICNGGAVCTGDSKCAPLEMERPYCNAPMTGVARHLGFENSRSPFFRDLCNYIPDNVFADAFVGGACLGPQGFRSANKLEEKREQPYTLCATSLQIQDEKHETDFLTSEGPCEVSDRCVTSPRYPLLYPESECVVAVMHDGSLSSRSFVTRKGQDILSINGKEYSGKYDPLKVDVRSGDLITWKAAKNDGDPYAKVGWELCLEKAAGSPTAQPAQPAQVCADDPDWVDNSFGGSGTSKCNGGAQGGIASNPTWCTDYGEYSLEARRACPVACGTCPKVSKDSQVTNACTCIPCGSTEPFSYVSGMCRPPDETCSSAVGSFSTGCYSSTNKFCDCVTLMEDEVRGQIQNLTNQLKLERQGRQRDQEQAQQQESALQAQLATSKQNLNRSAITIKKQNCQLQRLQRIDVSLKSQLKESRQNQTDLESKLEEALLKETDLRAQLKASQDKDTHAKAACADDLDWTDSKFGGDGNSKCNGGKNGGVVANPSWCKTFGDYSTEARRACPRACGLCPEAPTPAPTPALTAAACADDLDWTDSKFGGDGNSKCNGGKNGGIVANPSWCKQFGDYSTEARRACPRACGLCPEDAKPIDPDLISGETFYGQAQQHNGATSCYKVVVGESVQQSHAVNSWQAVQCNKEYFSSHLPIRIGSYAGKESNTHFYKEEFVNGTKDGCSAPRNATLTVYISTASRANLVVDEHTPCVYSMKIYVTVSQALRKQKEILQQLSAAKKSEESNYQDAVEKNQDLEAKLKTKQEEVVNLTDKVHHEHQKALDAKSKLKKQNTQLQQMRTENQRLVNESNGTLDKNDELQEAAKKEKLLELEVQDLRSNISHMKDKYRQELKESRESEREARDHETVLEKQLNKSKRAQDEASFEAAHWSSEYDAAELEKKSLNRTNQGLQNQLDDQGKQVANLKQEVQASRNAELKEQAQMEQMRTKFQRRENASSARIAQQKAELTQASENQTRLQNTVGKLRSRVNIFHAKLNKTHKMLEKLRREGIAQINPDVVIGETFYVQTSGSVNTCYKIDVGYTVWQSDGVTHFDGQRDCKDAIYKYKLGNYAGTSGGSDSDSHIYTEEFRNGTRTGCNQKRETTLKVYVSASNNVSLGVDENPICVYAMKLYIPAMQAFEIADRHAETAEEHANQSSNLRKALQEAEHEKNKEAQQVIKLKARKKAMKAQYSGEVAAEEEQVTKERKQEQFLQAKNEDIKSSDKLLKTENKYFLKGLMSCAVLFLVALIWAVSSCCCRKCCNRKFEAGKLSEPLLAAEGGESEAPQKAVYEPRVGVIDYKNDKGADAKCIRVEVPGRDFKTNNRTVHGKVSETEEGVKLTLTKESDLPSSKDLNVSEGAGDVSGQWTRTFKFEGVWEVQDEEEFDQHGVWQVHLVRKQRYKSWTVAPNYDMASDAEEESTPQGRPSRRRSSTITTQASGDNYDLGRVSSTKSFEDDDVGEESLMESRQVFEQLDPYTALDGPWPPTSKAYDLQGVAGAAE